MNRYTNLILVKIMLVLIIASISLLFSANIFFENPMEKYSALAMLIMSCVILIIVIVKDRDCSSDSNNIQEGEFKDINGNTYKTVVIGNIELMREGLKTKNYNDGDPIPFLAKYEDWVDDTKGAACYNEGNNVLYNGYAVKSNRLAPEGWRIPTEKDLKEIFTILSKYYKESPLETLFLGKELIKKKVIELLNIDYLGCRHSKGYFCNQDIETLFWIDLHIDKPGVCKIDKNDINLQYDDYSMQYGMSVRFVRNI